MDFRRAQEEALDKNLLAHVGCKHGTMKKLKLGDVTTLNITALHGGTFARPGIADYPTDDQFKSEINVDRWIHNVIPTE